MIARVVVDVLRRHPAINASIDTEAGTVTYHDYVNLGIAVDTDRGLLVPNIKDAQALDVGGMARAIGDLATRTRERRVTPDDISGGTFTITNTGSRGTLFDTPILNPPGGRDPRDLRDREAPGRRRGRARRVGRHPLDDLPVPHLRPPARRRGRRRTLPLRGQGAARHGRPLGEVRAAT
jgi:hypothetical protein